MAKRAIRRPVTLSGPDKDIVLDPYGYSIINPLGCFDGPVAEELVEALNHRCPAGANEHELRAAVERADLAAGHLEVAESARRAALAERDLLQREVAQLRADLAESGALLTKAEARSQARLAQVDGLAAAVDAGRREFAARLSTLCAELGGEVDGARTGPENYLGRVRALRKLEAEAEKAAAKAARRAG